MSLPRNCDFCATSVSTLFTWTSTWCITHRMKCLMVVNKHKIRPKCGMAGACVSKFLQCGGACRIAVKLFLLSAVLPFSTLFCCLSCFADCSRSHLCSLFRFLRVFTFSFFLLWLTIPKRPLLRHVSCIPSPIVFLGRSWKTFPSGSQSLRQSCFWAEAEKHSRVEVRAFSCPCW